MVQSCCARRIASHNHIFLWKDAKLPGLYEAKYHLYITDTAEDFFGHADDFRKVSQKQRVYLEDIRVINEYYVRARIPNIGWVTLGAFDKSEDRMQYFFVRLSTGFEVKGNEQRRVRTMQRRIHAMQDVGLLPAQRWIDAEGYRLRPKNWNRWSYEFSGDSSTVKWRITGLFASCQGFTQGDLLIPMESSGKNRKADIWSMYSLQSYVMPGCSVLEGKDPVELTLTMTSNSEDVWSGRVLLDPENFCDTQSGSDGIPKDRVGNVFLPIRRVLEETQLNNAVALWAISYRCFSIQASGFHVETGAWKRLEAHLKITKTVFHLLPEASECAGQWFP
eukprot:CAMPEP_0172866342 /NCGR_PEP_ID=MMETSP1075-20121228/81928_1 /TAXON_ID=2916 /ORGANISM="Ceratium fusus, Strain PA161109" /LENGTH=333 /DNA_ID=CAMNT_0013715499 /DNA_START=123 /DNA_END=1120 /DNA_ORIENTATION=-